MKEAKRKEKKLRKKQKEMAARLGERWGKIRYHNTLRWHLTLFVFFTVMLAGVLTVLFTVLMFLLFGATPIVLRLVLNPIYLCVVLLLICAGVATALTGFLGRYYLRPINRVVDAIREVRHGNYKVKVKPSANHETEVGELIDNFNDMVRELDGIELFRSDFINNFSHEFKTPIVSIRGFAKELQQGDLSEEERQEYARIIAEEAGRLAKLSTDVLELSKLENQQIVGNKTAFYLDEQLRQCILRQEPLWTAKQLEILPELDAVRFCFNEEMLAHVWTNLLSNAIKFTPEGGTVRVVLLDEGDSVLVRVEDTGIGMTPDVQAHIFEKFYQGDPSHHQKGYGIGLSLVDRIVRLGGGTVTVESEVGKGTTFSVRLPKS